MKEFFDYPSSVYEKQLASFIKMDVNTLIENLKTLHQFGIIQYNPQKDKPQVQFLQNRVATQDFTVNQTNLVKRKQAFEKRVKAITGYVKNESTCRSKIIGNYFNDMAIKPCGICDNCIREKNLQISTEEFESIKRGIYEHINKSPLVTNDLFPHLKAFKKDKVWKVLNYLQSENQITIDKEGTIGRKGLK